VTATVAPRFADDADDAPAAAVPGRFRRWFAATGWRHLVGIVMLVVALFPVWFVVIAAFSEDGTLSSQRLTNRLLMGFAVIAVMLAAAGIYGVMSLNVNSRVQEFGIRTALGAGAGDVLRLVLGNGMRLAAAGIGLGVVGGLWLTRLIESLLFEVKPTDPLTFAAATLVLSAVALLASYVPARRATRVDPVVALRNE